MKTAKGIKGIRKFIADNRSGWHILVDDELLEYRAEPVSQIFACMGPKRTFLGWSGNALVFTDKL